MKKKKNPYPLNDQNLFSISFEWFTYMEEKKTLHFLFLKKDKYQITHHKYLHFCRFKA